MFNFIHTIFETNFSDLELMEESLYSQPENKRPINLKWPF